eukprot:6912397-Prymnesium_polylepis.1
MPPVRPNAPELPEILVELVIVLPLVNRNLPLFMKSMPADPDVEFTMKLPSVIVTMLSPVPPLASELRNMAPAEALLDAFTMELLLIVRNPKMMHTAPPRSRANVFWIELLASSMATPPLMYKAPPSEDV